MSLWIGSENRVNLYPLYPLKEKGGAKLQIVEQEIKYLGHQLSKGTKKLDPDRISGILALVSPRTKRQVRQMLGLTGYCRQWIEDYSGKVKFLYNKLNKDGLLKWTKEDEE